MKNYPLLLTTIALAACAANAQILLVDVSNPAAVKITAGSANASIDNAAFSSFDGVTLLGFLTSAQAGYNTSAFSSDLLPAGTTAAAAYLELNVDEFSGSFVNLNLYEGSADELQVFSTSTPAFTGEMSINLSSIASSLPTVGTTGDVRLGYNGNQGPSIGSYTVIPEPSAYAALAGVLALGLVAYRRRR